MESNKPLPEHNLEIEIGSTISALINANFYYLQCAFIITSVDEYRLLVIRRNQVLWDKNYKSLRGAKIAFAHRFSDRVGDFFKKNQWSHHYDPENDWLMDKLNLTNNGN